MLAVTDGSESVVLQPSRPAALLAALLLNANSVVSADFLQRVIWGEETPAQAKSALHSCVLRLRRLFGKYGIAGNTIEAVPGGYRLTADADTLDLVQFREVLDRAYATGDADEELRLLRAALALWQPPLLGNVPSDLLHRDEVPRLHEEWLRAIERVFDLELACGRYREAVAEIWPTARAHPLHERFTEQLMEALHRVGRRAEALGEYRRLKTHLAQQLGVDPGPALQRLELSILRGEPAGGEAAERDRPEAGRSGAGGSAAGRAAGWSGGSGAGQSAAGRSAGRSGAGLSAADRSSADASGARADGFRDGRSEADRSAGDRSDADWLAGERSGAGRPEAGPAEDSCAEGDPVAGEPVAGGRVLDSLVGAGLLEEGPRGHYRMHELLRVFTRAAAAGGVGAAHAGTPGPSPIHPQRPSAAELHPTEA